MRQRRARANREELRELGDEKVEDGNEKKRGRNGYLMGARAHHVARQKDAPNWAFGPRSCPVEKKTTFMTKKKRFKNYTSGKDGVSF